MKTFRFDFKKITGLIGAMLFAGSLMIGQFSVNAYAQDPGEDDCNGICVSGMCDCGPCITPCDL